ncbi:prepilin-type N-terminal cleavage/methylation domain-containing protein [bacterium]|nr:prepilin-type N-terminal cleavage/methylation domain-containing protein [bacterium]
MSLLHGRSTRRRQGSFGLGAFTLIELLIVVAIIAILAAIAVPNFLEAQVRAKISRVHNDLRTVSLGMQAYMVDNNKTPYLYEYYSSTNAQMYNAFIYHHFDPTSGGAWHHAIRLTTPVAYLDTIAYEDPFDTFGESHGSLDKAGYVCLSLQGAFADGKFVEDKFESLPSYTVLSPRTFRINGQTRNITFHLASCGPDKKWQTHPTGIISGIGTFIGSSGAQDYVDGLVPQYDPTNGTNSAGEIWRFE